jgi:hypothetical protein
VIRGFCLPSACLAISKRDPSASGFLTARQLAPPPPTLHSFVISRSALNMNLASDTSANGMLPSADRSAARAARVRLDAADRSLVGEDDDDGLTDDADDDFVGACLTVWRLHDPLAPSPSPHRSRKYGGGSGGGGGVGVGASTDEDWEDSTSPDDCSRMRPPSVFSAPPAAARMTAQAPHQRRLVFLPRCTCAVAQGPITIDSLRAHLLDGHMDRRALGLQAIPGRVHDETPGAGRMTTFPLSGPGPSPGPPPQPPSRHPRRVNADQTATEDAGVADDRAPASATTDDAREDSSGADGGDTTQRDRAAHARSVWPPPASLQPSPILPCGANGTLLKPLFDALAPHRVISVLTVRVLSSHWATLEGTEQAFESAVRDSRARGRA